MSGSPFSSGDGGGSGLKMALAVMVVAVGGVLLFIAFAGSSGDSSPDADGGQQAHRSGGGRASPQSENGQAAQSVAPPGGEGVPAAEPTGATPATGQTLPESDPSGAGPPDSGPDGDVLEEGAPLEQAQQEQAREVASRFIEAAYGYSGDSEDEYRQGVMEHSQSYDLLSSPGGEDIQFYARKAGEEGISAAASLTVFEASRKSDGRITATVEFVTGSGYGEDGEVTGPSETLRQQLSLRPHQDTYKVNHATRPEPA